ncbi:NAD(P)H-hydrate dehydratase [Paenibacillus sp. YN15]|uniref:NAD(P)H-hydrate dehydratase n=1 Tax=Paenibacillus sp. YN15 TaxID=1742774 RepID=UPI000DCB9844|nr:NAD(P)H-hydrate dehydratase [Paenibacillus sp. YN15]RAV04120.1 bifunctional ADP-dependent NAD(P)H-hydrate dehydratase/NAD(P)H-hydrate epimerase [Paenibacillus sp. YN15]
MFAVTSEEMRRLDRRTIEEIGIPAMVLMENAGRAIAEEVLRLAGRGGSAAVREGGGVQGAAAGSGAAGGAAAAGAGAAPGGERAAAGADSALPARRRERWLVLAGKGNNGGDGFAAARHLMEAGVAVDVALAVPAAELSGEAAAQAAIAARFGVPCLDASASGAPLQWERYSGVVDALLGTGAAGAPREPYAALIRAANASGLPIVAADIPSGMDADTGAVHAPCIRAASTVALAFLKRGLLQYPGAEYAGQITVAPIGIPSRLAREEGVAVRYVTAQTAAEALSLDPLRPRAADTHKGTYGHVLVAAGSAAMMGAGLLSASAALRGGSGLVSWALPASLTPLAVNRPPELMLAPLTETPAPASADAVGWSAVAPQALRELANSRSAMLIGPGLGRWAGDSAWLRRIWEETACPLVVDADALNMLADAQDFRTWIAPANRPAILTPHPGEMSRLLGIPTAEVQRDRIGSAIRFAREHNVVLVLKGARTVTALPDGRAYINGTGNPGMATGGAGDVLAGLIASLLAQGYAAGEAAALGVYLHGAAGDRAAQLRPGGSASLLAGDIVAQL